MLTRLRRLLGFIAIGAILAAVPAGAAPGDEPQDRGALLAGLLAAEPPLPQSFPGGGAQTAAKVKCDCWVCEKAPYKRCKKPAERGCPYRKNVRCGRCCFNYK